MMDFSNKKEEKNLTDLFFESYLPFFNKRSSNLGFLKKTTNSLRTNSVVGFFDPLLRSPALGSN
jgi:hypothetical protein